MHVRTATPEDRAFVLSLAERFAEFELPPWLGPREVACGTARRCDAALAAMDDRSTVLIACDEDGARMGFAWLLLVEDFYTGRDAAKLSEIAVVRDGTGAGTALMKAFVAWARERGCDLLQLNVMQNNARARAFYERFGFAPEYTHMVRKADS